MTTISLYHGYVKLSYVKLPSPIFLSYPVYDSHFITWPLSVIIDSPAAILSSVSRSQCLKKRVKNYLNVKHIVVFFTTCSHNKNKPGLKSNLSNPPDSYKKLVSN
jgi:hypothetical protein